MVIHDSKSDLPLDDYNFGKNFDDFDAYDDFNDVDDLDDVVNSCME